MSSLNKSLHSKGSAKGNGGAGDASLKRRKKEDQEAKASYLWLVSFTDVMALMLTFFVLLFSMSEPKTQDWAGITTAMYDQFNQHKGGKLEKGKEDVINIDKINFSKALNLSYVEALLESEIRDNERLNGVTISNRKRFLSITIPSSLIFEGVEPDITDDGRRKLYAMAGLLSRIKNRVEVVGYSSPSESNVSWGLSMQRSSTVAGILQNAGYTKSIIVRGRVVMETPEDLRRLALEAGLGPEEQELQKAADPVSLRRIEVVVHGDDGHAIGR